MIILADESVDVPVINFLREKQVQIVAIIEISPGITDDEVLEIAFEKEALLLTFDKDFGELTIRFKKPNHGIILVRLTDKPPIEKAKIIYNIIQSFKTRLRNKITVIYHDGVRTRDINY